MYEVENNTIKIYGGKVLIIGDLHISDVFTGKHKDYLANCYGVLGAISKKVSDLDPSVIVFLGDLVGWNESNIRSREILAFLCKWFMNIGINRKIFCVRGNHDTKGYPEFQFLSDLKLFETSSTCSGYFDYYGHEGQTKPEVRFHLVDYGQENRHLDIAEGTSNIVLGHNNYTIQGLTNWYQEHDGIELAMLQNFDGVDMVVSGHIHNPSPEFVSTSMVSGQDCSLFYVGCPTRPIKDKNCYEKCWYLVFEYDKDSDSTGFDAIDFKLSPISEEFYSDEDYIDDRDDEEDEAEVLRQEALHDVIGDMLKYRICGGDLLESIDAIPNATTEAKEKAKGYLQFALNSKQS